MAAWRRVLPARPGDHVAHDRFIIALIRDGCSFTAAFTAGSQINADRLLGNLPELPKVCGPRSKLLLLGSYRS
jgi:hypothetical protein